MADQVIQIKCKGSRMAPLAGLEIIQGDLKELSAENEAKLRRRIEEKGFDAPLFVWKNKVLDGTQRVRVLTRMLEDGWELPNGQVPVCDIRAASLAEAKDRLLGFASQYGNVTEDGLYEFLCGLTDPDVENLDLPGFDWGAFKAGFLDDDGPSGPMGPNLNPEIDTAEVTGEDIDRTADRLSQAPVKTKEKVTVACPKCGKSFMVDKV